jgi:hypothetical protein
MYKRDKGKEERDDGFRHKTDDSPLDFSMPFPVVQYDIIINCCYTYHL